MTEIQFSGDHYNDQLKTYNSFPMLMPSLAMLLIL